jgi:hypothetical protein
VLLKQEEIVQVGAGQPPAGGATLVKRIRPQHILIAAVLKHC